MTGNQADKAKPARRVVLIVVALALPALVAWLGAQPAWAQPRAPAAISPVLEAAFAAQDGPLTFLVILDEQADAAGAARSAGVGNRRAAIYAELTEHAARTQAPLRAWLDARGVPYRPFYMVNMIAVTGDAALAEQLRALPGVNRLAANPVVAGAEGTGAALPAGWRVAAQDHPPAQAALPWGLAYTHAPQAWAAGVTGQGIVIGSQDTGVDWDHPALIGQYRGWNGDTQAAAHAYNWFDAWGLEGRTDSYGSCEGAALTDPQVPCDDWGHGTHTVGTMVGDATALGDTVLGMAPGAQWIGCRNMRNNFGTPASYTACFEFFLAPYPQGGDPFSDGKPELGAQIINNSWGCPPAEGCDVTSLRQVVEAARAAGQFVAASAGNNGPGCGSVSNPIAMHNATFSVGAFDYDGSIASFSSRGPVVMDGSYRRKPDLAAPGVFVRSTWLGENVSASLSGTSMASPHVAGAVALLWSAVPTLTGNVELTEQVLYKSATPIADGTCEADQAASVPNNTWGFGRLDAAAALEMAQHPGTLTVRTVDDAGAPLAGVHVRAIDALTGYTVEGTTGAGGDVTFAEIYSGTYRVDGSAPSANFAVAEVAVGSGADASVTLTQVELPEKLYFPQIFSDVGADVIETQ